jgi:hypothetical protein
MARLECLGRIAVRASAEITSPTLFRSVAAISLAAARTSSSMARVVRKSSSSAKHHASNIIHH